MGGDAFEREHLGASGKVIHREKVTYRAAFLIVGGLSLATAVLSGAAFVGAAAGDPQALAVGAFMLVVSGVLGLASVVGSVLRTVVTDREVVLHAGIRHEVRIPLAGITGVALTRYDLEARKRVLAEGKGAFAAIHPSKPSVRVEWIDGAGADHVAFVASEAPEALADVLRRASAAARAALDPAVRARVAPELGAADEPAEREPAEHETAERETEREPAEREPADRSTADRSS